ncbi:hypothetical protein PsorP6_006385 [Peronosclerospora sorghi]|uniref:Uncharacterized protein n=1 Tax=Peronosclerospora sorghi TaxID=230839 RepID=A0ACC0W638_9STRA|nr:hypothetical protein PsorP6_006385 [Peronosclerospora sorghi]
MQSMFQWLQPLKPSSLLEQNNHALELLLVLKVMYSHMLLSLDDEVFYDREWPLELAHVEALIVYCKSLTSVATDSLPLDTLLHYFTSSLYTHELDALGLNPIMHHTNNPDIFVDIRSVEK